MKILEKISDLFGKYLAIIVLAVAALSLFLPKSALWIQTSWVNYLLMVVMFGMGLTMKPKDFTIVFTKPKEIVVVILHNLLGYGCGFGLGKLLKLPPSKTKALSIEIGMQNSGLATSLAGSAFPGLAMATVPGAIFSVWHNISGAILAGIYRRWNSI